MRVGLTYDLKDDYLRLGMTEDQVAEFDSPETIEALENALFALGHDVDRIGHIKNLVGRLARNDSWDFVFNIAEGLHGLSREAQIPCLLEAYKIPFTFSSARTMAVTLDKALTKTVLQSHKIPTAPWRVLHHPLDLAEVDLSYPLFVKPVGEGSSIGVEDYSFVTDKKQLHTSCQTLWSRYGQPILVEPYLSGREFTVGVTGTGSNARILGVMELHLDRLEDGFARSIGNKQIDYKVKDYYSLALDHVAEQAGILALQSWEAIAGCDLGRVDIRCDADNNPYVLEVNALPGLTPGYSDLCILAGLTGITHHELVALVLEECFDRYQSLQKVKRHAVS